MKLNREILELYVTLARNIDPLIDKALEVASKVLCISPHPDDCEIGAGGTLAKLVSEGKETYLVVMTDGSKGTIDYNIGEEELANIRRTEQLESAKIIGFKEVHWMNVKDGELTFSKEILNKLISLIRTIKPDIVFTPDPFLNYEAHPDHYYTGKLASAAVIFSGLPLFNKSDLERGLNPHSPRFVAYYYTSKPNTIVDVSAFLNKKIEALKKHRSQFVENSMLNIIVEYMKITGRKIKVDFAEEFKILPTSLLHIMPIAEYI